MVLERLVLDRGFVRELPGDTGAHLHPRQVHHAAWSAVTPTPVSAPSTLAVADDVAQLVGITPEEIQSDEFAQVFGGNQLVPGMAPFAMCYGGHQFGNWAGQLGDGRAMTLGEVIGSDSKRYLLQLKGAGPTPYSRSADGRAVLRSSIREFLCSEAMFHLGVPTTRALCLVATGDSVMRDMFYDGHPKPEPGAVVCRVATSFTRFGNFELPASRGDLELLSQLVAYTLRNDFPEIDTGTSAGAPNPASVIEMFREVCRRTAVMVVEWLRVGFVHGVMNTDNMSILGLTIDYGPYGWLDDFNPGWTPNTTDATHRRYRFGNQPAIAQWNLACLANSLLPLVADVEAMTDALDFYGTALQQSWLSMMRHKLGLVDAHDTDGELFDELAAVLSATETDMTLFYRSLADVELSNDIEIHEIPAVLMESYYSPDTLITDQRGDIVQWLNRYRRRVNGASHQNRRARMNLVHPKFVLRNYLAQLAIDQATAGDLRMVTELAEVLKRPYDEHPEHGEWAKKRPDWARNAPGCSMLSCSS